MIDDNTPATETEGDDVLDAAGLYARLSGWVKDDLDHSREWRDEAKEDYDFVAGEQWTEEEKQTLRQQLRPVITFNRIGPIIDSVSGSEVNNRQEVRYLPRSLGDAKVSELYTHASAWFRDQCHAEDEESDAFTDAIVCGMGWTETRLDFISHPNGEPIVERIDPLEMVWDLGAKRSNLMDARRIARVKTLSLQEAKELFPDADPAMLDAAWARDEDATRSEESNDGIYYKGDGEKSSDPRERMVTLVHCQWKELETYYRVVDPLDGTMNELSEDDYALASERGAEVGMPIQGVKQSRYKYRYAWLGGEILEEGDNLTRGFSWACITGKRDRNKGTWYGIVRGMKDPQRFANKWLSQSLDILNKSAKGGVMAEVNAFADQRQAERSWAKPEAITWVNPGAIQQGMIQPKPVAAIPPAFADLIQFAVSSIRDVSGINLEILGMREGQQAGVLEYQRKQAAMTVMARMFDSLRRYRKVQGETMLELIRDHLADGRLVRIVGEEGEKFVPLMRQEDAQEYDVVVDDAPSSPNEKERTWQIIGGMLPAIQGGLTPTMWASILKYSPLPSTLVDEITAEIRQNAQKPPQNPMVQIEQQKLQAAQMKAQAEMQMRQQEAQADLALQREKTNAELQARREAAMQEMELEREKLMAELRLKMDLGVEELKAKSALRLEEMKMEAQLKRESMALGAQMQASNIERPEM
jgi:hypothetical protein